MCSRGGCAWFAVGGHGGVVVCEGGDGAAVVDRRHEGCFFANCFTEDGLDVFIAPLVGLPVVIAEGFGNGMDVELVDESLVGVCFGGGGCHFVSFVTSSL